MFLEIYVVLIIMMIGSSTFGYVFQVTFGTLQIYMWTHTITPIGKTVSKH